MASPKLTEAQRKLRELLVQSGVTEQRASHLAQMVRRSPGGAAAHGAGGAVGTVPDPEAAAG